jgi:hypothetical protein
LEIRKSVARNTPPGKEIMASGIKVDPPGIDFRKQISYLPASDRSATIKTQIFLKIILYISVLKTRIPG